MFYKDRVKILTKNTVKLLDHPIGLACLYMDDGSLVIGKSKQRNRIYLSPQLTIYSLNFTKEENVILKNHINDTFKLNFVLKKRPDGNNYVLAMYRQNDIVKFLDLVRPYWGMVDKIRRLRKEDRL